MIFRTYTKQGQILLDSQTPVFALIKTVTPTRLLTPPPLTKTSESFGIEQNGWDLTQKCDKDGWTFIPKNTVCTMQTCHL